MTARLFELAWKVVPALPAGLVRFLFALIADLAWLVGVKGVRQLELNLSRVLGTRNRGDLRSVTRAGMRSYMRYYAEVLRQSAATPEQVAARVRITGRERLETYLSQDRTCVLALGHLGNWDEAGVWAGGHLAPVTTVAEHLKPEKLFQDFLGLRERAGIDVVPLEANGVFGQLVERVKRGGRRIVPLLADRDLGAGGVEVEMFGRAARVAPGPAALAVTCGAPLFPAALRYERLRGARRRQAGWPWGVVVEILPEIPQPATGPTRDKVQAMTQAWVTALADAIRRHPADWHMLQKVFVADLDPDKDRAVRAGELKAR